MFFASITKRIYNAFPCIFKIKRFIKIPYMNFFMIFFSRKITINYFTIFTGYYRKISFDYSRYSLRNSSGDTSKIPSWISSYDFSGNTEIPPQTPLRMFVMIYPKVFSGIPLGSSFEMLQKNNSNVLPVISHDFLKDFCQEFLQVLFIVSLQ